LTITRSILLEARRDPDTDTPVVRLNGRVLDPARSLRVRNHSPTGFGWGYAGSGPSQLALAVLLAAHVPRARAERLYQHFKMAFIQTLPEGEFRVEIPIADWVAQREQAAATSSSAD